MADNRKLAALYAGMGIIAIGPEISLHRGFQEPFDYRVEPPLPKRSPPVNPKKAAHRAKVKAARKQKHGAKR